MGGGQWSGLASCVLKRTRTATKAINKLTRREKVEIEKSLQEIQAGAPNLDICRLTADEELWRQRTGDWRILLEIDFAAREILVLGVSRRGDAYRFLPRGRRSAIHR
jgi:mRNA-degrading endonuclease RelE of RelBE toxin-antitoxin system